MKKNFDARAFGTAEDYMVKLFTPTGSATRRFDAGRTAFMAAYFRPSPVPVPILVSGVLDIVRRVSDTALAGLLKTGKPDFVTTERVPKWTSADIPGAKGSRVWYQVRPLLQVNDQKAVEKVCRALESRVRQRGGDNAPNPRTDSIQKTKEFQ